MAASGSLERRLKDSTVDKQLDKHQALSKREHDQLREIRTLVETLKAASVKVKTEGVRDHVDKLCALVNGYARTRDELNTEWRFKLELASRKPVNDEIAGRLEETESRILGALGTMSTKLQEHEERFEKLSAKSSAVQERESASWTEVVGRRKGIPARTDTAPQSRPPRARPSEEPIRSEPQKQNSAGKQQRPKPMAVIVTRGKKQFPELLKTVRQKVDPATTGTAIAKLKQTKSGNLLVEINGGLEKAEIVRVEIERSLGPNSSVRLAQDSRPIEIRDLDGLTTKEEVLDAIEHSCGPTGAKLVSL